MERKNSGNLYLPEGSLLETDLNVMYCASLSMLERAMNRGRILEAVAAVCDCSDMSLHVDFGFAEGIIPRVEAQAESFGKDIAVITRVGKPVCFKVMQILSEGEGKPRVILSRRAAQEECKREYISKLSCGDIIPAAVTHLDSFGAFVDIGCGIVSLICVDSISVSRIFHPKDRLSSGQRINAVVKTIEKETGRIYMSLRELLGTWEENAASFSPGSCVSGIVRSVESYGIFVELSPNLAGLAELREGVVPGDCCSVYIKSIIPERMKIKLVIIDSHKGSCQTPIKYFVDVRKEKHLDRWRYSPEGCKKVIETVFDMSEAAEKSLI